MDNRWNLDKLNACLDHSIVQIITSITIPLSHSSDEFIWGPSASGKFSVKSATWIQCESHGSTDLANSLNKVWKLNLPPKVKFFPWLLLRGRLKTKALQPRLNRFNNSVDRNCCFCNNGLEDINHLVVLVILQEKLGNCFLIFPLLLQMQWILLIGLRLIYPLIILTQFLL